MRGAREGYDDRVRPRARRVTRGVGLHDVGLHDVGLHDAGLHDAGLHDAGSHDAGSHDAGPRDVRRSDVATQATGTHAHGSNDTHTPGLRVLGPRRARATADVAHARAGFALVVVLLVLLALLVLCTPFLLSARNADRASVQLADRTEGRLAIDAAARHVRHRLADSHPAVDATPYFDTEEELDVGAGSSEAFPDGFLDPHDPAGLMWDYELADVAGKIDLNSASPYAIANLLGGSSRFVGTIETEAKELALSSTAGLEPAGYVWASGELIHYARIEANQLVGFERGVLGPLGKSEWLGGPRPPWPHDAGTPVIDQRALAPCLWRMSDPDGRLRLFDSVEEISLCAGLALSAATEAGSAQARFDVDVMQPLLAHATVHGGVRAGRRWRHPTRLVSEVEGGRDGILEVDSVRWINPGTTLQIDDGITQETALVQDVAAGKVRLDRVLTNDYEAHRAIVRVLARRPVNLNTASPEVLRALFANLQIAGRNMRITKDEAATLAALVVESRPFDGFEDFFERIVLPAGGLAKLPADAPVFPEALKSAAGFLDPTDALALYTNGLDANDGTLAYSTMPYSFTTRDTYDLELRASVNAPSGVERFAIVHEEVDLVVPQKELLSVWARQCDFDEAVRLDGEAPWWMSGPSSTARWWKSSLTASPRATRSASPLSPLLANVGGALGYRSFLPGIADSAPAAGATSASAGGPNANAESSPASLEHVFTSREKDGWIQLWPARVEDDGPNTTAKLGGRVLHFDDETRDAEGRFLPDEPVRRDPSELPVAWTFANGSDLVRPLAFSLWVKPRTISDATLLDLGGSTDSDRISLYFDATAQDLVLRVLDAGGDQRQGAGFVEQGEARYAIAAGTATTGTANPSPGLPLDVWSHVAVDVRGTRPDQIHMLVNGLAHGVRTPGLTRLASSIGPDDLVAIVESIEGFPSEGIVQIGKELIEYQLDPTSKALNFVPNAAGPFAGQGGRRARERFHYVPSSANPSSANQTTPTDHVPQTNPEGSQHPEGSAVRLYGYSGILKSSVAVGEAPLPAQLGAFAVSFVMQAVVPGNSLGEPIIEESQTWPIGFGIDGQSEVTELVLGSADPSINDADAAEAFPPNGGYVLLCQRRVGPLTGLVNTLQVWVHDPATAEAELGGAEILKYTSRNGNRLQIAGGLRGDQLGFTQTNGPGLGPRRAFVVDWQGVEDHLGGGSEIDPDAILHWKVFAIPISVPAPGSNALSAFLRPNNGISEFAQITRIDDRESTEWVRYDEVRDEQLIRCSEFAVSEAFWAATRQLLGETLPNVHFDELVYDTGATQTPGFPIGTSSQPIPPYIVNDPDAWSDTLGAPEPTEGPITRAVRTRMQFRGVMGTYSHTHPAGTLVLPVFRTERGSGKVDSNRPGPLDRAFLVDKDPSDLGTPVTVHHAYQPEDYVFYDWEPDASNLLAAVLGAPIADRFNNVPGPSGPAIETDREAIYVGLTEAVAIPFEAGAFNPSGQAGNFTDPRLRARLIKHPSGELPRNVTQVAIGGGFDGADAVPAALVDEVVFGDTQFGDQTPAPPTELEEYFGGLLMLGSNLSPSTLDALIVKGSLRIVRDQSVTSPQHDYLDDLPQDAGLVRIGDEILAYDRVDASTNAMTFAPNGRGMLGTRAQFHDVRDPILFLEHHPVSVLTGDIGAGDSILPIADLEGFPDQGLVLIGEELIHYTRKGGNTLEMPRASLVPGTMDEKGVGLFRGRFGTTAAPHQNGEAVVVFPFRYWDRWEPKADAPELAYFGLSLDQPNAFWSSFFFFKEDVEGAELGVLARTDETAPWDLDPDVDPRIKLFTQGNVEGAPLAIGTQSDALEWRVFVRYLPGAFLLDTGLAHGWRQSPRLSRLGAFYFGPGMVLRSVER